MMLRRLAGAGRGCCAPRRGFAGAAAAPAQIKLKPDSGTPGPPFTNKVTVVDVYKRYKAGKPLTMVTAYDYPSVRRSGSSAAAPPGVV